MWHGKQLLVVAAAAGRCASSSRASYTHNSQLHTLGWHQWPSYQQAVMLLTG